MVGETGEDVPAGVLDGGEVAVAGLRGADHLRAGQQPDALVPQADTEDGQVGAVQQGARVAEVALLRRMSGAR